MASRYPSWSPYNYTLNNPINKIDPDGKQVKGYFPQFRTNQQVIVFMTNKDTELSAYKFAFDNPKKAAGGMAEVTANEAAKFESVSDIPHPFFQTASAVATGVKIGARTVSVLSGVGDANQLKEEVKEAVKNKVKDKVAGGVAKSISDKLPESVKEGVETGIEHVLSNPEIINNNSKKKEKVEEEKEDEK